MAECIFCQIVADEAPARRIYEDEQTLAFLDVDQISPGHCLVIPKKHVVWYTDLTPAEAGPFSRAMYLVARKINKAMNADYVSVLIRGTRIPHLHALLIPKLPGQDNIFDQTMNLHHYFQPRQKPILGPEELDAVAARIRRAEPDH
jgi:histidine triad (HIT) family protein